MSPDDPPRRGRRAVDDRLVVELATGRTIPAAAAAVGVSEKTVDRRLADAGFRQRLDDVRAEARTRATARLEGMLDRALDRLEELTGRDVPEAVALRAVLAVLDQARSYRDAVEVEAVLDQLRRDVEKIKSAQPPGGRR